VATDVPGDLAAACGVADQDRIPQVQRFDDGCEIVGIAVHVVVGRRLARAAMTAPVERHATVAMLHQEQHLAVPGIGIERPPVREGHDRAAAPILVVDLRTVRGGDRAHRHGSFDWVKGSNVL
jgi:hypothetical protein